MIAEAAPRIPNPFSPRSRAIRQTSVPFLWPSDSSVSLCVELRNPLTATFTGRFDAARDTPNAARDTPNAARDTPNAARDTP